MREGGDAVQVADAAAGLHVKDDGSTGLHRCQIINLELRERWLDSNYLQLKIPMQKWPP